MRYIPWVLGQILIFVLIRFLFIGFVGQGPIDVNNSVEVLKVALAFALSLGMVGVYTLMVILRLAKKI